jgi:hypothetical protein
VFAYQRNIRATGHGHSELAGITSRRSETSSPIIVIEPHPQGHMVLQPSLNPAHVGRDTSIAKNGHGILRFSDFELNLLATRITDCENASIHNPAAKLTRRIDFVRKHEILARSFFRAKRDPSRQSD